jgi:hypothetical protein
MLEPFNDPVNETCGYRIREWHYTCPNCHEEVWMKYYPELNDLLYCKCNQHVIVVGFELSTSPDGKKGTTFIIRTIPLWKVEECRSKGQIIPKRIPEEIRKSLNMQYVPECKEIPEYVKKSLIDALKESLKLDKSLKDKNPENP